MTNILLTVQYSRVSIDDRKQLFETSYWLLAAKLTMYILYMHVMCIV